MRTEEHLQNQARKAAVTVQSANVQIGGRRQSIVRTGRTHNLD